MIGVGPVYYGYEWILAIGRVYITLKYHWNG